jgi:hypothetical protein
MYTSFANTGRAGRIFKTISNLEEVNAMAKIENLPFANQAGVFFHGRNC